MHIYFNIIFREKINPPKPQSHGFFVAKDKAEEKQSLFKFDFEDQRQGEGRGQKTRIHEANLRQNVWNQRLLDGQNKERLRQSSGLHMHM